AGLDGSIAKASERGENWLGYYWAPTTLAGKYNLKLVDFNSGFDQDHWDNCIVKPVEECDSPKRSTWTVSEVVSLAQVDFTSRAPEAAAYVANRTFDADLLNKYLSYMHDNQASGEEAAIEFMLNEEATWSQWVTKEAAARIKKAL
ncbi:MAG: ABC transporter substrate-binding protein, partial [Gammaproteobacteria bacterium]|nr:ABC transporter substrate-binding protein [Gammaproteobacteria bacterium]